MINCSLEDGALPRPSATTLSGHRWLPIATVYAPVVLIVVLLSVFRAHGKEYSFTNIVDIDSEVLREFGEFDRLGVPIYRDGRIAFLAHGESQDSLFVYDSGTLTKLADLDTVFRADVKGWFTSFENLSFDGTRAVFHGVLGERARAVLTVDLSGTTDVYSKGESSDYATPFDDRSLISVYSDTLAVITRNPIGGIAVHANGGAVVTSIDSWKTTGGSVQEVSLTEETLFYRQTSSQRGVYAYTSEGEFLDVVTREEDVIPDGTGAFGYFHALATDDDSVAFRGQNFGGDPVFQQGIYLARDATGDVSLERVADLKTRAPESDSLFTQFAGDWTGIAVENETVAFRAETDSTNGAYFFDGSDLSLVINSRQRISGRRVVDIDVTDRGMEDGAIAMWMDFTRTSGIYLAQPVPPPGTQTLHGGGMSVFQGFDQLEDQSVLPAGWSVSIDDRTTRVSKRVPHTLSMNGAFHASETNAVDRALAIGVTSEQDQNSIRWKLQITDQPIRAIRLQYDVEAWAANLDADTPGEAAFRATLNIGDETFVDFGTTTTGAVLTPGRLNGNESPNRASYDSGIIEIDIPVDTPVQLNWAVPNDGATNGWLIGLDNVSFRALAPGDADANDTVDVDDLLILLAANKFNQGVSDVTWAQGDFNADDQFNTSDLLTMLAFLSGQFPSDPYASEAGGAVADVIVNSETGEITIDLAGHTASAIIIESAAEIFNGKQPDWDTTSQFPSTLPGELGSVLFTSTASGVDELGVVISQEFLGRDKEFYLQDLDFSILIASDGGALTKGNVIVVPEPSNWLMMISGILLVGWDKSQRDAVPAGSEIERTSALADKQPDSMKERVLPV